MEQLQKIKEDSKNFRLYIYKFRSAVSKNPELIDKIKELTKFLDDYYDDNEIQRLWHIFNEKLEILYCSTCKEEPVLLGNLNLIKNNVYKSDCDKCKKKKAKEKRKRTCIERYGVENPSKLDIIKNKIQETCLKNNGVRSPMQSKKIRKKFKETCFKNYGVESPYLSEEIKGIIKHTMFDRYGVENPMQNHEIINRRKKTHMQKHGVENPMQLEESKNKSIDTNLKKYGVAYPSQSDICKQKTLMTRLERYGSWSSEEIRNKSRQTHIERYGVSCSLNNGKHLINKTEVEISTYIESLGYEVKTNDRTILKYQEIDILIPSKNIGFEFNGSYWHSDKFKESTYHLDKKMEALNKNIDLYFIWDYEWNSNQEEVKINIKRILEGNVLKEETNIDWLSLKYIKNKDIYLTPVWSNGKIISLDENIHLYKCYNCGSVVAPEREYDKKRTVFIEK